MDLLDTLNIILNSVEKFQEVPEKEFHLKIGGFEKVKFKFDSNNFILKKLLFLRRFFFRGPLEVFLRTSKLCSRHLKGPPKVVLYASKKLWQYDETTRLYVRRSEKSLDFEI